MHKLTMPLLAALVAGLPLSSWAQAGDGAEDVADFVRGVYFHGLPYSAAVEHAKPHNVEPLLRMLDSGHDVLYWPNVTKVLGLTGSDAVVEPLIDFVHGDEEWSTPIYRGRLSGLLGLGYVVSVSARGDRPANRKALRYLLASVCPDHWRARRLPWVAGRADQHRLREQLSVSSVLALALTGSPEAADKLDELERSGATERLRRTAASVQDDLARIRAHGLAAYYGSAEPVPDEQPAVRR